MTGRERYRGSPNNLSELLIKAETERVVLRKIIELYPDSSFCFNHHEDNLVFKTKEESSDFDHHELKIWYSAWQETNLICFDLLDVPLDHCEGVATVKIVKKDIPIIYNSLGESLGSVHVFIDLPEDIHLDKDKNKEIVTASIKGIMNSIHVLEGSNIKYVGANEKLKQLLSFL